MVKAELETTNIEPISIIISDIDDLDLDTTQFWESRDESIQSAMNDRLLELAQNGTSEFISILEKESSSPSLRYSVDLEIVDNVGWTPLHHSSFNGHLAIVESIIKYQHNKIFKDNNNCIDADKMKKFLCRKAKSNGSTALHLACARSHEDIVIFLINRMITEYHFDLDDCINITDYDMRTPLHCAVLGRHYTICRLLLHHKADRNKVDIHGKTPLGFVKERSMKQFLRLFSEFDESSNNVENKYEPESCVPMNNEMHYYCGYLQHQQIPPNVYYYNFHPVNTPNLAEPVLYTQSYDQSSLYQSKSDDQIYERNPPKSDIRTEERDEHVEEITNDYNPAHEAIKSDNKYLRLRYENLESERNGLAAEYQKRLNEEKNQWKLRAEPLLNLLESKQTQIHELRHSLRTMRKQMDALPFKMRQMFYRNEINFSKDDEGKNTEKVAVNNLSNDRTCTAGGNMQHMPDNNNNPRKYLFTNITSNAAKSRQCRMNHKSWKKK